MFITHKGKIMKNKRNQKNIIWKILLIIFSIVLIICLIIIGIQKYQQKKQQEYYEALLENESTQTQATEEMPEPETEEAPDEVAERIDRAPKYCSDIERGTCGMSTETMLAISECLDMSLDYMMFGEQTDEEARRQENDELAVIHILSGCSKQQRDYAIRLLKLYIASMQIS